MVSTGIVNPEVHAEDIVCLVNHGYNLLITGKENEEELNEVLAAMLRRRARNDSRFAAKKAA